MSLSEGSFVWYELMTADMAQAQAFYAKVVGWSMADSEIPGMRYTLAKINERQVAGLMDIPPDTDIGPAMWFGYILVSDVDAMTEQVRRAGGGVHREPMDIPGIGRFAVVTDPQGAVFMLFHGSGGPALDLAPSIPGNVGWRELHTSDPEGAFVFYQGLFGWEKSYAHDMGPMGIYQTFSVAGAWTGGMMTGSQGAEPHWLYYFAVDDIGAAAARVTQAGGQVLNGPHEVPGGSWVIMATDPQGTRFALTGARRG